MNYDLPPAGDPPKAPPRPQSAPNVQPGSDLHAQKLIVIALACAVGFVLLVAMIAGGRQGMRSAETTRRVTSATSHYDRETPHP